MKVWNEITCQYELDNFMNLYGGFHDSCIKEFKYLSGAFVSKDLSMHPVNDRNDFKIVFQRQANDPSVIEMEFIGLLRLSIYPVDEKYTCEVLDANMILGDNCIYWYDCKKLSENELYTYTGTLICSSKVRWRVAEEYIGYHEIY
jgi:hypothetical protein